jgi:putative PIG3 family NAD(P)H quinone oxidoreductase
VLVRVRAAGLNRADLLQRRGLYPPPQGYSPNIPGLEFAGEVIAAGQAAARFRAGDRVFGITAGEAQAEMLVVDERLAAAVPDGLGFVEAAAVPEVFTTAHDAVFTQAGLGGAEWLLVNAVGSGVGLAALQLAKAGDAHVIGTSRTREKLDRAMEFGLDVPVPTETPDFADAVKNATGGRGADVILELVGAGYFAEDLKCAAVKGRIMLVGLAGGGVTEFDMSAALRKRLTITGTVLRSRSVDEKADAVRRFEADVLPLLLNGSVRPNLDRVFAAADIRAAHRYLEGNESFGKVVIEF